MGSQTGEPPFGGWQLSGLLNYGSGFPISVYYPGYNTPTGFGSIRPDIVSSNLANGSIPGPGSINYQADPSPATALSG